MFIFTCDRGLDSDFQCETDSDEHVNYCELMIFCFVQSPEQQYDLANEIQIVINFVCSTQIRSLPHLRSVVLRSVSVDYKRRRIDNVVDEWRIRLELMIFFS